MKNSNTRGTKNKFIKLVQNYGLSNVQNRAAYILYIDRYLHLLNLISGEKFALTFQNSLPHIENKRTELSVLTFSENPHRKLYEYKGADYFYSIYSTETY